MGFRGAHERVHEEGRGHEGHWLALKTNGINRLGQAHLSSFDYFLPLLFSFSLAACTCTNVQPGATSVGKTPLSLESQMATKVESRTAFLPSRP